MKDNGNWKRKKNKKIGIWTSRKSLQLSDGRTREYKYYKDRIKALTLSIGNPSEQEEILIDDIAFFELKTRIYKEEFLSGKEHSIDTEKHFQSWFSNKRRGLVALGGHRFF